MPRYSLLVAAALLGVAAPAGAQARDTMGLRPAFRRIDAMVTARMVADGTPGLALALVDRAGVITVRTYGFADLERRQPVTPETRFQIGSISKSFTAIALLQLRDEGKLDLNRPVVKYLPWFTPASRWRPATPHDLLTHTSGLPRDRDDIPSSPAQAYKARERAMGSAPGSYYAYSNIGYQVLGVLLTTLDRDDYGPIIRRRVLEPVGIPGVLPIFTNADRTRLAQGYASIYDDRPTRPSDPLMVAPWVEYGSGDGALSATPAELATYLRMLLNRGVADHGRVMSEAAYADMMRPAPNTSEDDGAGYGYAMTVGKLDGRDVFGHSGGMLGYSAYLLGEPGLGIGAVAFVNGPGSAGAAARFAVRALGAAMRGDSLPALPELRDPRAVPNAADYAGTFRSAGGDSLVFAAAGDSLLLLRGDGREALVATGEDSFLSADTALALFPLRFFRDSTGVTDLAYGGTWYTGERYKGPRTFRTPAAWNAYLGHYRIMQPWEPSFRIILRKGTLYWVGPEGEEDPLTPLANGEFRAGGAHSAERLRFGDIVGGRALSATYSGMTYYRYFLP